MLGRRTHLEVRSSRFSLDRYKRGWWNTVTNLKTFNSTSFHTVSHECVGWTKSENVKQTVFMIRNELDKSFFFLSNPPNREKYYSSPRLRCSCHSKKFLIEKKKKKNRSHRRSNRMFCHRCFERWKKLPNFHRLADVFDKNYCAQFKLKVICTIKFEVSLFAHAKFSFRTFCVFLSLLLPPNSWFAIQRNQICRNKNHYVLQ